MTKRVLAAVAAISCLGGVAVAADSRHGDSFMNPPPKETVYATNHHLGFSWRASLIYWLGGATITDEGDLRASQREKWWGRDIPLLPADALRTDR
jgi:hypothetical protein